MPLIEDCVGVFHPAGEIRIVGVLPRNVRIHIVQGMRPRVAGQRAQPIAEAMRQVDVQRIVVGVPVVHVARDGGIWRLRIGRRALVARQVMLAVPVDPVGTGAVGRLRAAHLSGCGPGKRRRRIHVARTIDPAGVRAHVIHAEHPVPRQAALHTDGPLLGVRVEQFVLIPDQRGGREILVEIGAVARAHVQAA